MTRRRAFTMACHLAVGAGLLVGACHDARPQVGSETNFLGRCEAGCGMGLTCVCGACTRSCSGNEDCAGLAVSAECVAESARPSAATCAGAPSTGLCDLRCSGDVDCAPLGMEFACQSGYCRVSEDDTSIPACTPTLLSGDHDRSVTVGGVTRNYIVRVPAGDAGMRPLPLVVDFHTLGGTPAAEAAASGYGDLSERAGFVVAWPQGIDASWNIGLCCTASDVDDVGFARALVAQIAEEACIDAKRVYAVGIAIGGGLAYELACSAADVFAAIAPSAFDLLEESEQPCTPSRPLTVISFRGTADAVVPYDGGAVQAPNDPSVTIHLLGAIGTFQKWAELDQCSGAPSPADSNGCSTYANCAGGVEVTLCTTEGGGIAWGSAELAWATLERHALP